jgi:phospholipid/cholesterol/gamma-HCH transport system substrate-binding protein
VSASTIGRLTTLAGITGMAALLAACGYHNLGGLSLPGAISGSGTYPVTVVLDDATNLVPAETCRANDAIVGSVTAITLGPDLRAHVTCAIKDPVRLPANTTATVAETSLLGERYVSLAPPTGTSPAGALPAGALPQGALIPADRSTTTPSTEEILGSLSMVLNGGNLQAVHTIATETNQALGGHEKDIRSLLGQLTTLTGQLDARRADITASLDGLDRLSGTLAQQRDVLGSALDTIPAGLGVLNQHRQQILTLTSRLAALSHTATPVLRASITDTVTDLRALDPILAALAQDGRQIPPALELLSFPIPRNGLHAVKGDYAGSHFTIHLDPEALNSLITQQAQTPLSNRGTQGPWRHPAPAGPLPALPPAARSPLPALPPAPGPPLPGVPPAPTSPRLPHGGHR